MEKINLVIACWGGKRFYDKFNSAQYLEAQIKSLEQFKHNLAQITFVMNDDPSVQKVYRDYFSKLPYIKLVRPNVGISYGAWLHAYLTYTNQFDYYIFIEDDYCFVQDNFDTTMLDLYKHFKKFKGDCSYLCQYKACHAVINGVEHWHAAISNGMISAEALAKTVATYGPSFPWGLDSLYEQVDFSTGIIRANNGGLCDMRDYFLAPFKHRAGSIQTFCTGNKQPLLVPFEMSSQYIK